MHNAKHTAEGQHRRQHPAAELLLLRPAPGQPLVQDQPAQAKCQHSQVLLGVLHHTQAPAVLPFAHRHQGKRQGGEHGPGDRSGGALQVGVGVLPGVDGHGRHDQQGHIVPPGIVAGIEGIKGAVQDRHQGKDSAHRYDPLTAVPPPGPPVGHYARQTAQGQIGGHAGPLDGALRPDRDDIGGIRGQDPADQDGQVLLHRRISQKAPPGGNVRGARILQQGQKGRPYQQAAHSHSQQTFKSQGAKQAPGQFDLPGGQFADKVDDEEHHLPHKKEIVVEQVERHKESEQAPPAVVDALVQGPQHPGEQGYHVNEVVEKDVVDAKPRKGVQAGRQDCIVQVFHIAAHIQVGAAPRHGKLEHQQRAHQIGQPALGKQGGQPEKGRPVQIERIGVHDAAAQVGSPREGIGRQAVAVDRGQPVGIAHPLHKAVHIPVKADLLAVEIPGIMEKPAVDDLERQKDQSRREGAQPHRQPKAIPFPPQLRPPGQIHCIHHILFSPPNRLVCILAAQTRRPGETPFSDTP